MAEFSLDTLRHSCAHVMAQAVKELWPEAKLGIGPSIEDGFYYDFDIAGAKKGQLVFTPQDLEKIEERMKQIIEKNLPFIRQEMDKDKAKVLFKELKENYKLELIEALADQKVTIYKTGDSFVDLCRGPHLDSTGQIKAFKLLSVAGAYWHGIETNPMLQRIYGTAFFSTKELDEYLQYLKEAKTRDHRILGREMNFFDIYYEEAGAGLVFYHPKGALLRTIIEDYLRKEHLKRGYDIVITPHIMKQRLWQISGHYDYYRENMYIVPDPEDKDSKKQSSEYVLKPMNCPGHILIYKSQTRSYRDLPLRFFELGTVYRFEKSGVLHGLLRVRGFTQDDAHIFCLPEQLDQEISSVLDFVFEAMRVFGFGDFKIALSTRPAQSIGSDDDWQRAQNALEHCLRSKKLDFTINPGEGAFYGPKVDIKLRDALKREWQCATIQCDFALPQRFELEYIGCDGKSARPIMLHRVILGSLERFMGALLEHYKGVLPLWLCPVQVVVLPIKDSIVEYAQQINIQLQQQAIRSKIDSKNETLQKRIRQAELEKIPYIIIVGEKEKKVVSISVRKRSVGDRGSMKLEDFIEGVKEEIRNYQ